MRYAYHIDGKVIGFYELNPMPGCNQLVISNHAWIAPHLRGKGFGQTAHKERLDEARRLGYDYICCTVKETNVPQIIILKRNGWKLLDTFYNNETETKIYIYGKNLTTEDAL